MKQGTPEVDEMLRLEELKEVRRAHNAGEISTQELTARLDRILGTSTTPGAVALQVLGALKNLKDAVEYTPLGTRGIKAVEQARLAIHLAEETWK